MIIKKAIKVIFMQKKGLKLYTQEFKKSIKVIY